MEKSSFLADNYLKEQNQDDNLSDRILFATIVHRNKVGACLRQLKRDYQVYNDKVFVLNHKDDKSKLILTYNIISEKGDDGKPKKVDFNDFLKNTINIHRRKETNTLFTINSLNQAKLVGGGEVNWDNYKNSLILTRLEDKEDQSTKKLVQIHTSLNNVVDLNEVRDENHQNN